MKEYNPFFDPEFDIVETGKKYLIGKEGGIVLCQQFAEKRDYEEHQRQNKNPLSGNRRELLPFFEDWSVHTPQTSVKDISETMERMRIGDLEDDRRRILQEGIMIEINPEKEYPDEY